MRDRLFTAGSISTAQYFLQFLTLSRWSKCAEVRESTGDVSKANEIDVSEITLYNMEMFVSESPFYDGHEKKNRWQKFSAYVTSDAVWWNGGIYALRNP